MTARGLFSEYEFQRFADNYRGEATIVNGAGITITTLRVIVQSAEWRTDAMGFVLTGYLEVQACDWEQSHYWLACDIGSGDSRLVLYGQGSSKKPTL
jgi:hypothetical protein